MKTILVFITLFCSLFAWNQIDYSKLLIARNLGTHTFFNGQQTRIFGYAESLGAPINLPSPTLDIISGDSIKIDLWNVSQGAPHTIHLHGLDVDQQNDGVGMLSFEVEHMDHGYYYFKAPHPGTYLYHCHVGSPIHLQAGMYGMVIVRPTDGNLLLNWDGGESYDREFALLNSEVDTVWHNDTILDHVHDPLMPVYVPNTFKPQYFLINGKSDSQLADPANYLTALQNEKVYMRLVNIGYYGIRYIFQANVNARTVASDGRPLPSEQISDTVEVLPGERYETFLQLGTDPFYPFVVEFFNLNTNEVESTQTVTIQTSMLETDELENNAITIFPNPSEGLFHIKGELTENYTITTIDGKLIRNSNQTPVDLSTSPLGTYIFKYKGNASLLIRN